MIPCLMLTYNRLEYTKQALQSLLHSDCGEIFIIDNASDDGTQDWLTNTQRWNKRITLIFNKENLGIAGAMNQFLEITKKYIYAGKVDNDTLVPPNWCKILLKKALDHDIDIIQAKHHIIKATNPNGWNGFVKTLQQDKTDPSIYYNHFVGGSGIIFKRSAVDTIPTTEWKLGGFRQYQREHPELKKAFCSDVEIALLDEHGYNDYPSYYKATGRLQL